MPRYRVKSDILVFQEETFAELIDINEEGLSCRYLVNLAEGDKSSGTIDLIDTVDKLCVPAIPCRLVYMQDEQVSPTRPATVRRTCGLEFSSMPEEKLNQVRMFVEHVRIMRDNG